MHPRPFELRVDGLAIHGEFYLPDRKPYPGVIICHGVPAGPPNPADQGYAQMARGFQGLGFGVFLFNFRGAGRSQGNFHILGWAQDLKAIVAFARAQEGLSPLAVMASSGGAAAAVYVAAREPRIDSLVLLACPAHFDGLVRGRGVERFLEHCRTVGIIQDPHFPPDLEAWRQEFREVRPLRWIDQVSPRPLLLVHGRRDELIPVAHARALYKRAREPKELVIIPRAGHRLRREEQAIAIAREWLGRWGARRTGGLE